MAVLRAVCPGPPRAGSPLGTFPFCRPTPISRSSRKAIEDSYA